LGFRADVLRYSGHFIHLSNSFGYLFAVSECRPRVIMKKSATPCHSEGAQRLRNLSSPLQTISHCVRNDMVKSTLFIYRGPLFLSWAFLDEAITRSMNSVWVIPEAAAWWKRTVEGVIPGRVFGSRTATFPSFLTNISILA